MKKKLLSLTTLLFTGISFSQITVNSSLFYNIGDSVVMYESSVLGNNDLPGTNKTWDFSTVNSNLGTKTKKYVSPNSTPNGGLFSTSNVAEVTLGGETKYFDKQIFELVLMGVDNGNITTFSDPEKKFLLPLAYQYYSLDNFRSEYTVAGNGGASDPDSIKYISSGESFYTVDSWGSLILPTGVFDALRVKDSIISKIGVQELNNGTWTNVSASYETVAKNIFITNQPGSNGIIVEQILNSAGGISKLNWNSSAIGTPAGVNEKNNSFNFTIYPNPVQNVLHINSNTEFVEYVIKDVQGKTIQIIKNKTSNFIPISFLEKGSYILTLKNKDGATSNRKFVKL